MNVSLFQAAAALEANMQRQQMIAENLAASSVPGFKKRDMAFSAVQAKMFNGALDEASKRELQFLMPSFQSHVNFSQGTLQPTGVSSDIAIDGPGFLAVQGQNGQTHFTRDGTLRPNRDGVLSTKEGHPVLGIGGPIQLDPNNANPISISTGGDVSQGGLPLGRIRLVNFDEPSKLQSVGNGYFSAGTMTPREADPAKTSLRQGFLEGANTTPMQEMAELMQTIRHFEANQRLMQMHDDRTGKIIQELTSTN